MYNLGHNILYFGLDWLKDLKNESSQYSLVNYVFPAEYVRGEWVPFKADDVQMEFVRIDPFVRQRMINKNGILTAKFKVKYLNYILEGRLGRMYMPTPFCIFAGGGGDESEYN